LLFLREFVPPDGQPFAQVGWAEWLLLPELYIFRHRAVILGGLPILVPATLVCSASLRMMHILTLSSSAEARKLIVRIVGWEATTLLGLIIAWHFYDLVCPRCPWHACESGLLLWGWIFDPRLLLVATAAVFVVSAAGAQRVEPRHDTSCLALQ
jgi:hypothetical protein